MKINNLINKKAKKNFQPDELDTNIMKILSLYPWTHISSSALMVNGKIVSAAPEERFTRKMD